MKHLRWIIPVILAIVGIIVGCSLSRKPASEQPLRFVIIPAEEATLSREQFAPMMDYLGECMDTAIALYLVSDYAAVVEAMKYGHADIARFGPLSYVLGTQEADIEVIAVTVKGKTNSPTYQAYIIARRDRHVTELNGVSFAFTDVGSTSGYLAPQTYFRAEGIEPGQVFFSGSHNASIAAVQNGTVDAGAVASNRYDVAVQNGVIGKDELEILWASDPIPANPIAVQKAMPEQQKALLLKCLVAIPKVVIERCATGEVGLVPATDADFDFVRDMQAALEEDGGSASEADVGRSELPEWLEALLGIMLGCGFAVVVYAILIRQRR